MIVTCEECGKKYQVYPDRIKEDAPQFQCKNCRNWISIPEEITQPAGSFSGDVSSDDEDDILGRAFPGSGDYEADEAGESMGPDFDADDDFDTDDFPAPDVDFGDVVAETQTAVQMPGGQRRVGLLGKMLFLFLFVPVFLIIGAGLICIWQLDNITRMVTLESTAIVSRVTQERISDSAWAVAEQVKMYLDAHPELQKEGFNRNSEFRKIAMRKVGKTGYTALYERPSAKGEVWRTWVHQNPDILGVDMNSLRKPMGKNFPAFWKIYTGVLSGREASGFYKWHESGGVVRDKYMTCVPVRGTRFVVASTTYVDEFAEDVTRLKEKSAQVAKETRYAAALIVSGMVLVIFLSVFIYAKRLSTKIRYLIELAEKISVGELDTVFEIYSNDEIGDLGKAIRRMQESIRHSISRLRKR